MKIRETEEYKGNVDVRMDNTEGRERKLSKRVKEIREKEERKENVEPRILEMLERKVTLRREILINWKMDERS